jgi:hypothetical protein
LGVRRDTVWEQGTAVSKTYRTHDRRHEQRGGGAAVGGVDRDCGVDPEGLLALAVGAGVQVMAARMNGLTQAMRRARR